MEGVEGQVRLGCLPRTRLCFWVFFALWSDLDIQLVDNFHSWSLFSSLSVSLSMGFIFLCLSIFLLYSGSLSVCVWLGCLSFFSTFSLCISLLMSFTLSVVHWTVKGLLHHSTVSFFVGACSCRHCLFTVVGLHSVTVYLSLKVDIDGYCTMCHISKYIHK